MTVLGHLRRFWYVRGLSDTPQDQRTTTATAVSEGSACNDSLMPIATPAVTDFGASDKTTARGSPAASASATTETTAAPAADKPN
jgi:hypothetical protein